MYLSISVTTAIQDHKGEKSRRYFLCNAVRTACRVGIMGILWNTEEGLPDNNHQFIFSDCQFVGYMFYYKVQDQIKPCI